jgi:hypothetical protein
MRVINLLKLLKGIFRKTTPYDHIPKRISDSERIVRAVFSPINVNPKTKKLKSNTFRSPAGKDEVSVTRLDFAGADFCKNFSVQIQNPNSDRGYFGLGVLNGSEIYSTDSDVVFTPILKPKTPENPYHADIKIGYIADRGEQLPAEFQYKVNQLTQTCRFYEDPNPQLRNWKGSALM